MTDFPYFPVQQQPPNDQRVNVVRWVARRPWYYALISSFDEEVVGRTRVRLHLEMQCMYKSWFDALQGPPFPAMNGLALAGSMRNFTLSVQPAKLWEINGVLGAGEEDVDMQDEHAQPAHFHEGNWVEVLFGSAGTGLPIVLRLARQADPALLDIDYDERLAGLRMVRRVRPPRNLIRLKRFVGD